MIHATVQHAERAEALNNELGIEVGTDNAEAVRESQIVLVCVKPQTVAQVMEEIAPVMTPDKVVISVAAPVPTDYMEKRLKGQVPVIRAMPNTPAMLGAGMTAICRGKFASEEDVELAKKLFDTVGRTVIVDEKHMDAVTGLSASGPALSTSFWNRWRRLG